MLRKQKRRKAEVIVIQFSVNGEVVQESKIDPNWTVLQYLRTNNAHKAVKEGCAGGDCGACSILIADQDASGAPTFQAINACIALMGSIDGKQIITADGLTTEEQMHPVQQAMVDLHGSQCGFCTPGIIASLTALYHNNDGQPASEHEIHDALSGNLCRCTGYRPIIEAAKAMTNYPVAKSPAPVVNVFDPNGPIEGVKAKLESNGRKLFLPETEEQLQTLMDAYPEAVLWAGGTDLGLEVTQGFKQFETIICLQKIKSLTELSENSKESKIGAMVTYSESIDHLNRFYPAFSHLIDRIAAKQIRNLGTLGGNVANASPIGDTPPVFLALNARVELASSKGTREVSMDDFFTGYKQTVIQPGEYLKAIIIPKLNEHQTLHVHKVSKRKEDDISAVLMAVLIEREGTEQEGNDLIKDARIACGGMAATPLRAIQTEAALKGAAFSLESFEAAAKNIAQDYSPIADVRATAKYRVDVATNLIIKTGLELFSPEELVVTNHAAQGGQ